MSDHVRSYPIMVNEGFAPSYVCSAIASKQKQRKSR
jgi:hypothetical protein